MSMQSIFPKLSGAFVIASAALLLVACGGGGSSRLNDFQESNASSAGSSVDHQGQEPVNPPVSQPPASGGGVTEAPAPDGDTGFGAPEAEEPSAPETESPVPEEIVRLQWLRPTQRENGAQLDAAEMAGYELRFKAKGTSEYQSLLIEDYWVDSYELADVELDYHFEIAAYDANGLYSQFVTLTPYP